MAENGEKRMVAGILLGVMDDGSIGVEVGETGGEDQFERTPTYEELMGMGVKLITDMAAKVISAQVLASINKMMEEQMIRQHMSKGGPGRLVN